MDYPIPDEILGEPSLKLDGEVIISYKKSTVK